MFVRVPIRNSHDACPPPSAIGRQALLHDFITEFRSPTTRFYYHTDQHTVESFVARLGERLSPALAAPFEEVVMPDFVPDPAAKEAALQVRRGRRRRRRHAQQPPPRRGFLLSSSTLTHPSSLSLPVRPLYRIVAYNLLSAPDRPLAFPPRSRHRPPLPSPSVSRLKPFEAARVVGSLEARNPKH